MSEPTAQPPTDGASAVGTPPATALRPPPIPPVTLAPAFGRWADPAVAAGPTVLAAAAVVGVVAAVALPWTVPGLGWWVTAVVAGGATVLGARSARHPDDRGGARVARTGWTVLALLLIGVGTIRAAGWLFVFAVPAACVAGSLAVAGGTRVAGLFRGALVLPVATVRAVPWLAKGLSAARTTASTIRTLVTVLITVALLIVFTSLFAGADPAFDRLLGVVLPTVDEGTVFRWIGSFLLLALGTLGAIFLRAAPLPPDAEPAELRTWRRIDWALPVGALVALFAAFVAVQATVLFGGNDHVLSVPSLTYAEYARTGFWQLLVVTMLTLVVLGVAARKGSRATGTDRGWLRLLLGALAVLTLVIVASALYRMQTYEQAYGFTRLRILVSACELWFGVVFALVLVAGIRLRNRATWLPRAILASAMLALLGVAALNPDRFIADQNVTRYEQSGRIDLSYLADLSADAVPALNRLPEPQRSCALRLIALGLKADATNGWIGWNLGRQQAEDLLVGYVPVATFETCDPAHLNPRR